MKTLTKLLLNLVGAFCLFLQTATAQNIPDPNFADAIREVCPACIDDNDNLTPAAQNLDSLVVSQKNISNLAGIEGFTSLQILDCSENQLESLPALPDSLTELDCSYNYWLSSLPILPSSLTYLNCSRNQLSSLPTLPDSLTYLNCRQNHLTFLPSLPDSLKYLNCSYNPSLSCLPFLPNGLNDLSTFGTQITCIPNLPLNLTTQLPLCSEPCDSSVSTSNVYAAKPFTVQPNPVSEVLQVRFSADYEANADLRLLNSNGQIVRALSGKGDVEILVGDLPEGVYWLEVRGAGWVFGEKILKK